MANLSGDDARRLHPDLQNEDDQLTCNVDSGSAAFIRSNLGIEIRPGRFVLADGPICFAVGILMFPDAKAAEDSSNLKTHEEDEGGIDFDDRYATLLGEFLDRIEKDFESLYDESHLILCRNPSGETCVASFAGAVDSLMPHSTEFSKTDALTLTNAFLYVCSPGNILIPDKLELSGLTQFQLSMQEFKSSYITNSASAAVLEEGYRLILRSFADSSKDKNLQGDVLLREVLGGLQEDMDGAVDFWLSFVSPDFPPVAKLRSSESESSSPEFVQVSHQRVAQLAVATAKRELTASGKREGVDLVTRCIESAELVYAKATVASAELIAAIQSHRQNQSGE
jgi:hypothetical protein